jgi:mono/diheme cytochrome c family protein
MKRTVMKRAALAALLAAGAAAAVQPLPVSAAQDAIDAKRVFDTRCARCHTADKVATSIEKRPSESREAWLAQFLAGHFPPDEPTRKALAEWLLSRTRSAR